MPDSHNTCRRTLEGKQTKKARKSFDFRAFFAEREVFEPITLTTYATMSYIPKFQIGNETVTIFRRWACPTLTAVCLPNFRVQR